MGHVPLNQPQSVPDGVFPNTPWSEVLQTDDDATRRQRLAELCQTYWTAVFALVRARGVSRHDALDLTQEFFCSLLGGGFLARFDRSRGRFRHFLKGALRKFMHQDFRDRQRIRRGGDAIVISLDHLPPEAGHAVVDETPDDAFDRRWAETVMAEALERLETELTADGREASYRIFEAYDLQRVDGGRVRYEDVAAEFGMSRDDVKNHLTRARGRLRQILLAVIAQTAATAGDAVAEFEELFASRREVRV